MDWLGVFMAENGLQLAWGIAVSIGCTTVRVFPKASATPRSGVMFATWSSTSRSSRVPEIGPYSLGNAFVGRNRKWR